MNQTSDLPKIMRAVLLTGFGGIDKLEYREDVPVPTPRDGEVLIKVGACGMNNTDINTRTRWYGRDVNTSLSEDFGLTGAENVNGADTKQQKAWKDDSVDFPRIQGAAIAGTIVAVGTSSRDRKVGERVLVDPCIRDLSLPRRAQLSQYIGKDINGGFAEYAVVPAINAHVVETSLSDAELATFPTSYDTAEEMLVRARLSEGETVVITGAAGGVGSALIQLSLIRGARVIAIAGQSKGERLLALGAHHFVARESADVRGQIEAIVGERAVHVVADVVGGEFFPDALKLLGRGGRFTTGGAIGGPIQPFDLRDLIYKDLEMYGITNPVPETFKSIVDYVASGRLKPVLEKAYPLKDLPTAQSDMVKRSHLGKLVITP
ncbi:alcohol dehydrogenase [Rhizobium leguminosarum bv. trifolii]|uniref:alcohol dehydrogenase family protein n=1 Tax=Rhizobium leguminosarum TaxID=384 RepID=UPI000E2FE29B|nr:alcohol dehydrogenase family protein [Rhizobium leguminosarum]RFB87078.1 alcohol dehydrogenase [Rhizobium leguminosarum bv. trifolii]